MCASRPGDPSPNEKEQCHACDVLCPDRRSAAARRLRDRPSAKMLIQGTADERGSREYNVGLGQRRSDSVKKMLILLGARDSQIEAVSLGEEKPACSEHSEECWAKNRRDDMLYNGEY